MKIRHKRARENENEKKTTTNTRHHQAKMKNEKTRDYVTSEAKGKTRLQKQD
jgi:hypothetical protein